MRAEELADLIERPEIHRMIVGTYTGPYSLGVLSLAGQGPAFVLKVANAAGFPTTVTVDGHTIPVVVQGGFRAPVPQ